MNAFILLILMLPLTWAKTPDFRVGDILLQPLACSACDLIEAEEETIFSHMGIIISTEPQVKVAEAYGSVREITLDEFLKKTEKNQQIKILRIQNERAQDHLRTHQKDFLMFFRQEFLGSSYDNDFLWNNLDVDGREKFYCSEFVSKYLLWFMGLETPRKKMHFNKNRDAWERYFNGKVPDGKWGNSPGDFERSDIFYEVQE